MSYIQPEFYQKRSGYVLGFHGCDKRVAENVLSGKEHLKWSQNSYDWLGNGVYFWEHNLKRAWKFVLEQQKRGRIENPTVIGAILDLGLCFDLLNNDALDLLSKTYQYVEAEWLISGQKLPKNKSVQNGFDLILRNLDCTVIEFLHKLNTAQPYDSVRGVFWEGGELYPNAGFKAQNHIQICIRNMDCVKGYFRPMEF